MDAEKKVAVITGASQGIGAALVTPIARRATASSRRRGPSSRRRPDIHRRPRRHRRPDDGGAAIAEGVERFGRIDTLVNNAGIFIAKPFTRYTQDDFDGDPVASMPPGFFHITQLAIAEMEKRGAATSSRSPRAWSTTRTPACRRRSRR